MKILKNRKYIYSFLILAVLSPIVYYSISQSNNEIDFNTEIRPILNKNCITCHGGVKRASGFSLLFRTEALQKNESGKVAIIPGNPDESEFMKRLTHHDVKLRMPLNAPRLKEGEIEKLRTWIAQGAKWADHWAYVKPVSTEPPSVSSSWPKNGIDHFIYERLEKEGLKPSEEADRNTLARRVSLDLTGLPPSKKLIDNFINDKSEKAYEKLVDQLLKSPSYGERWAAMWLDLARYADSKGYQTDGPRNIWLYRDWVIHAFNNDKPFDRFTIEQLAGDMLPNSGDAEIIATAFHRNTLNNEEAGTDDEEFRVAAVIDRVNTTWEVWQSTTIGCVQCHSHPYDPFKHKEYYQFLSFFNNTKDADRSDDFPVLSITPATEQQKLKDFLSWVRCDENVSDHVNYLTLSEADRKKKYPRLLPAAKADFLKGVKPKKGDILGYIENGAFIKYKNIDLTHIDKISYGYASGGGGISILHLDSLNGEIVSIADLGFTGDWDLYQITAAKMTEVKGKHDLYFEFRAKGDPNTLFDLNWIDFHEKKAEQDIVKKDLKKESMILRAFLYSSDNNVPIMEELPITMSRKTNVFIRGNWLVKGEEVKNGVPGSMNKLPKNAPNNRLGMAMWLVSPENPLTGRVIVNRFWEQLFGTGIVETLEDFGTQGMKPSHPELLDWLSLEFTNKYKWSMKTLLKTMVMSSTYRQSSKVSPEHLEKDMRNRFLARGPRVRLTAEQVRDQALAVSGLLSKKMFGPSVYPPQPEGIWNNPNGGIKWFLSNGEDRYRRALYTFIRRSSPYPSMMTFDAPGRTVCMSRRIRTNTPLQSLVTLNDTVYVEAARMMAQKMILTGGKELKKQLTTGYELAMLRAPQPKTIEALNDLYNYSIEYYRKRPSEAIKMAKKGGSEISGKTDMEVASMTVVANAILNLDEFITKE